MEVIDKQECCKCKNEKEPDEHKYCSKCREYFNEYHYMFMHRVWQAWVCMVHLIVKVVPFDYFGSRVPQAKIGKGLFCFW